MTIIPLAKKVKYFLLVKICITLVIYFFLNFYCEIMIDSEKKLQKWHRVPTSPLFCFLVWCHLLEFEPDIQTRKSRLVKYHFLDTDLMQFSSSFTCIHVCVCV